ncbi:MAG: hypothetical protein AAGF73_03575 [Actinomycetota bacterium]
MTDIDVTPTDHDEAHEATSNRRALLAKLAVGSAGAAVGAVALGRTASAADDSNLILGDNNNANNTSQTATTVRNTPTGSVPDGPSAFTCVVGDRGIGGFPYPAAIGGYGHTNLVNGVHGSTDQLNGLGAVAANVYDANVTSSQFAPEGFAAECLKGPQMRLIPNGEYVGQFPGRSRAGQLFNDRDGTLWYVVPVDQDDPEGETKFIRLGGTPTAGAVTFLEKAERCADTRENKPAPPGKDGKIEVDLTKNTAGQDTGVVSDATAAIITMTVTNTTARGFFQAFAAGTTFDGQGSSNGNWVGDDLSVAATIFTRLNGGKIDAGIGGNGTADIVIDVTAFYR